MSFSLPMKTFAEIDTLKVRLSCRIDHSEIVLIIILYRTFRWPSMPWPVRSHLCDYSSNAFWPVVLFFYKVASDVLIAAVFCTMLHTSRTGFKRYEISFLLPCLYSDLESIQAPIRWSINWQVPRTRRPQCDYGLYARIQIIFSVNTGLLTRWVPFWVFKVENLCMSRIAFAQSVPWCRYGSPRNFEQFICDWSRPDRCCTKNVHLYLLLFHAWTSCVAMCISFIRTWGIYASH